jgi:hypothetical protein
LVQTIRIETAKGVVGQIIFLNVMDYAFRRFNPAEAEEGFRRPLIDTNA